MAGFVASEVVDELTYDFKPFGPEGKILEPSATQIQNFRTSLAAMFEDMVPEGLGEDAERDAEKLQKLIRDFIGRDQTEMWQKMLHAIADVCSDDPSFDVLDKLPYRHQQAFIGWISGVFLLPQMPTPATSI